MILAPASSSSNFDAILPPFNHRCLTWLITDVDSNTSILQKVIMDEQFLYSVPKNGRWNEMPLSCAVLRRNLRLGELLGLSESSFKRYVVLVALLTNRV